jgi:hypothetical protein
VRKDTRVKEDRYILSEIKLRTFNWTDHILHVSCLLKRINTGKINKIYVTEKGGRRRTQLLDDFNRTKEHWNLEKEALDPTLLRYRFRSLWTFRERDYRRTDKGNMKCQNIRDLSCLKKQILEMSFFI